MKIKTLTLNNIITKELAYVALFTTIAIIAPFAGNQMITGPVVNATLFLSVLFAGLQGAIMVALFPSIIAIFTGILPFAMIPMIPFIIIGNILLVAVFYSFKENFFKGVVLASFAKFLFLYLLSILLFNILKISVINSQMIAIMGWLQLLTALLGGVLAYSVFFVIKR